VPRIEDYSFGRITIDGAEYRTDLVILPTGAVSWRRREGHLLHIDDLRPALESRPQAIVIGTGYSGMMSVSSELIKELESEGISVYVARTSEAVSQFNRISSEKKTVAVLHITC